MKTALLVLLASFATACAQSPLAPDAKETHLSLRVVRADDSAPIGAVTVAVTTADGVEITHGETALSGFVSFTVPINTLLRVDFSALGFERRTEPYRFTTSFVETAVSLKPNIS